MDSITCEIIWEKIKEYCRCIDGQKALNSFRELEQMITHENINMLKTNNDLSFFIRLFANFYKFKINQINKLVPLLISKGVNINHNIFLWGSDNSALLWYCNNIHRDNYVPDIKLFKKLFNRKTDFTLKYDKLNIIEHITMCSIENKMEWFYALYHDGGCPLELFKKSLPVYQYNKFTKYIKEKESNHNANETPVSFESDDSGNEEELEKIISKIKSNGDSIKSYESSVIVYTNKINEMNGTIEKMK